MYLDCEVEGLPYMREIFARNYFILQNDIPRNLLGEKYIDTLVEYRSQQN
jgi:hypothetical protein